MGSFISAKQIKGNWTADSINLNSETATRLLWVTDSWEQSCQHGRDTKFSTISTLICSSPQWPAHLKGITRILTAAYWRGRCLIEKDSSEGRVCFRQLLITQPYIPRALSRTEPHVQIWCFQHRGPKLCPTSEFLVWVRTAKGILESFPAVNPCTYNHFQTISSLGMEKEVKMHYVN